MSRLSLARATDADWADIITTDARAFAMRNPLPDDEVAIITRPASTGYSDIAAAASPRVLAAT